MPLKSLIPEENVLSAQRHSILCTVCVSISLQLQFEWPFLLSTCVLCAIGYLKFQSITLLMELAKKTKQNQGFNQMMPVSNLIAPSFQRRAMSLAATTI